MSQVAQMQRSIDARMADLNAKINDIDCHLEYFDPTPAEAAMLRDRRDELADELDELKQKSKAELI